LTYTVAVAVAKADIELSFWNALFGSHAKPLDGLIHVLRHVFTAEVFAPGGKSLLVKSSDQK